MAGLALLKRLRLAYNKIASARGSINEIAVGAAIGSFFGVFPTFGVGILIVLLLYKFMRFNIVAAVSASLISNPLTSPFFIFLSYEVGSWILNEKVSFKLEHWADNLKEGGWIIFIGAIVVSSTVSIIVYFITRIIVKHWREKKARKKIAKLQSYKFINKKLR